MDHENLFSCTLPKANLVSTQSSFTHFPEVSTSKIIHHSFSLLSFSLLSPSSPALSLLISTLLATSLLSLPVTGNSHNCRPQSHPTSHPQCRRQRVWLAESECSAPVGVCQQQANKGCCSPTYSKLEVKSLYTVNSDAGALKLADWE